MLATAAARVGATCCTLCGPARRGTRCLARLKYRRMLLSHSSGFLPVQHTAPLSSQQARRRAASLGCLIERASHPAAPRPPHRPRRRIIAHSTMHGRTSKITQ
jgi:hypothetical protein